jgi:DNA-binding NarL/FixJ family response regulator
LKRILVIQSNHLLAAGILNLLNREMDLIVHDSSCDDEVSLLERIKDIKPAVLVMDESSHLTDHISFFSNLNDYPDLRVIVIAERKNLMHILEIQKLEVMRATDLITAIRREDPPPC